MMATVDEICKELELQLECVQRLPRWTEEEKIVSLGTIRRYHFTVQLTSKLGSMSFNYSVGEAHVTPKDLDTHPRRVATREAQEALAKRFKPALRDVLECLFLDAEALSATDFEEWASDFGYDLDSRKAEQTYNACVKTGRDLRRVLGRSRFHDLEQQLREENDG